MSTDSCEMCLAVAKARAGQNLHLIHEFETSFLLVGSHQLFAGYSLLVSKEHLREPFEAPETVQASMFRELMQSARAIQQEFEPWKINYSCYGNQVPHVHWHLFPRYESDPRRMQTPWVQSAEFERHRTTESQARSVAARIQKRLGQK